MYNELFVTYRKKRSTYQKDVARLLIISSIVAAIVLALMFGITWPVKWMALSAGAQLVSLLLPAVIFYLCGMIPTHNSHPQGYYDTYDAVLLNGISVTKSVYERLDPSIKRELHRRPI